MKILWAIKMSFERARLESCRKFASKILGFSPRGKVSTYQKHPSAAKAGVGMTWGAARLKPCPFKTSVPEAREFHAIALSAQANSAHSMINRALTKNISCGIIRLILNVAFSMPSHLRQTDCKQAGLTQSSLMRRMRGENPCQMNRNLHLRIQGLWA